jgi:hypothetical protein
MRPLSLEPLLLFFGAAPHQSLSVERSETTLNIEHRTKIEFMEFIIDNDLLAKSRELLFRRDKLYWIVGGAGSGKTTICQALSARYNIPVYDMDAQIYGAYHGRFEQEHHPVNKAWSTSQNGLAWLLDMSWDEFDSFNQAELPEYLGLLAEDLETVDAKDSLFVDGGICNPALIARVIPPNQIVCLAIPERSSATIWEENEDRSAMKELIYNLPEPEKAWQKFLEYDKCITETILKECQENNISVCSRNREESVDEFAERVARAFGI